MTLKNPSQNAVLAVLCLTGPKGQNSGLLDFMVGCRVKKLIKIQKNIKNVFSNPKLTLEYIMDPWNGLVWSILKKVQKNRSDPRFGRG